MRIYFYACSALLLLLGGVQSAHADALIERMKTQLQQVRDYTSDVRLDATLPGMSISNMRMKVYYKRPGKVHIEAVEGFAMLPEQGLYIGDPIEEVLRSFNFERLGDARWQGKGCIKYAVRPKDDNPSPLGNFRLFVDREQALPVGFTGDMPNGGTMSTVFTYRQFQNRFWLPVKTELTITGLPQRGSTGNQGQTTTGKATLQFSNYRINTGLADSLFEPKDKSVPGSRR